MQTIKKTFETMKVDHQPWKEKPFNWLMHTEIPQVTPTQSANERAFTKEVLSVKPSNLPEGDKVLAKSNPPHKRCTTPYEPKSKHRERMQGNNGNCKELKRPGNNLKFIIF